MATNTSTDGAFGTASGTGWIAAASLPGKLAYFRFIIEFIISALHIIS